MVLGPLAIRENFLVGHGEYMKSLAISLIREWE